MTMYLDEAAALLRKAAEKNERMNAGAGLYHGEKLVEGQERSAMKFAQLAAIERGLIPAVLVGDLLVQIARSEVLR